MILRRLTKDVKDQNWFAVTLDFFIVVLGILIAFQITTWNELRGDRTEERVMLERLTADYDTTLADLDEKITWMRESVSQNTALAGLVRDKDNLADKSVWEDAFDGAFNLPRPPAVSETYEEMGSSGKVNIISSQALRSALSSHSDLVRDSTSQSQATREWTRPYITPLVRFRILLSEYPVAEAFEAAGSEPDMLVAIDMYQNVFEGQLGRFEILRIETAKVAELLDRHAKKTQ